MARTMWKDRIGEEKIVNGVTIKFVDYVDGMVVVVENLNHNTFTVSKGVWTRGVFKEIMDDLCSTVKKEKKFNKAPRVSKYEGAKQEINGVEFKVEKYLKGKVRVVAKGYEGFKDMLVATWKKARFFNNIMKVLTRIVEKVRGKIEEIEKKYELVVYNDFNRDFLGRLRDKEMTRIEREFNYCVDKQDVRKLYKHYARYVHPDLGHIGVYDRVCFEWLTALRDVIFTLMDKWDFDEDDED